MQLEEYKIIVVIGEASTYVDTLMTSYHFKYEDRWYIRKYDYMAHIFNKPHKESYIDWIRQDDGFIEYVSSSVDGWFKRDRQYFRHPYKTPEIELEFLKQMSCG